MSYDLYVWAQADGDVDEVLDALAEGDASVVRRDPRVAAFVSDVLLRWPELGDVLETGPDDDGAPAYVVLTLPFAWADRVDPVVEIATARGLSGWDPQADEPLGLHQPERPHRHRPGTEAPWTVDDLEGLGVGRRRLEAAWEAAGLGRAATFGEAAGAFLLGTAMGDGARITRAQARAVVEDVADRCRNGLPQGDAMIEIGSSLIDIGFVRVLARGSF